MIISLAQSATTDMNARVFYEFAPLLPITEWWHVLLAFLVIACMAIWMIVSYFYDGIELSRSLAWTLTFLRITALVVLITYFINLEKRSEERIVHNSRVAMLIDTSLSMSLKDTGNDRPDQNRLAEIAHVLQTSNLIEQLQSEHDLVVYQFDEESRATEIVSLTKHNAKSAKDPTASNNIQRIESQTTSFNLAKQILYVAIGLLAISLLCSLSSGAARISRKKSPIYGWLFFFSIVSLISAILFASISDLTYLPATLPQMATATSPHLSPEQSISEQDSEQEQEPSGANASQKNMNQDADQINWLQILQAKGSLTRMGDALRYLVNKERDGSIAGIVLITDGRSNTGIDYRTSLAAARDAGVPVYTIGAGSNARPQNIRLVDIKAPTQVYPGDKFKITGLVQSFGYQNQGIELQLFSSGRDSKERTLEDSTTLTITADGKPETVTFEVQYDKEGERDFHIVAAALPAEVSTTDNEATVRVKFIEKKQHVLLVAGGPSRDYRFLRNQLFRDPKVISHVYLQTAYPGADQEGDETLFSFPKTREEWFQYDCIIAFDPDWQKLTSEQVKWLQKWVAEKAGGLIVVAGPVNTPLWTQRGRGDEVVDIIRELYPVAFYNQNTSVIKLGRFGGEQGFPLSFSREGRAAEFLWLAETGAASQEIWEQYKAFGYYAVSEAKPGAEIFARFSDPETTISGDLPIYIAGQFYGAGRVYFQASSEMWRMRRSDPDLFEEYYTKLIRWASQGRLSRESSRGLLLLDKTKSWVGDQVVVQAILKDAQDDPLAYPSVTAAVAISNGNSQPSVQTLKLMAVKDGTTGGIYTAQLTTKKTGKYRISLPIPDSPGNEVLTAELTTSIPDLEIEQPQRNDKVLQEIATQTKGRYFENIKLAVSSTGSDFDTSSSSASSASVETLAKAIVPRGQETYLPGTTDRKFTRRMLMWLLGIFTITLCLEWIIRRSNRLA